MELSRRALCILFPAVAVLLFAQLLIPRSREPYPAILMPSGGTMLRADVDTLRFRRHVITAIHPDGSRSAVSSGELFPFLDSSPVRRRVVYRNFGLRYTGLSNGRRQFRIGSVALTVRRVKTTEPAARTTRAWLRRRVEEITGYSADSLVIEHFEYGKAQDDIEPSRIERLDRQVVRLHEGR